MDDMVRELQEAFAEEAAELFDALDNTLLESEQTGEITDEDMINLFRAMHTLKGSGASVELVYLVKFAHITEDFMDKLRNKEIEFDKEMIPLLIDCSDALKEIFAKELDGEMNDDLLEEITSSLKKTLLSYIGGGKPNNSPSNDAPKDNTSSKISDDSEDFGFFNKKILDEKAELLGEPSEEVKKALEIFKVKPKKVKKEPTANKKKETHKTTQSTIRVNLDKIDTLMNSVGELVITNAMLAQYTSSIQEQEVRDAIEERLGLLSRHIREMQESIMIIRMVPMENVYSKFPKLIRDNSKKLGKQVQFEHYGDGVEIDKAMIEGLMDPLVHIIRNSLDHGLEFPDERIENGKDVMGSIKISAEQENGQMIVKIKDDGRGINTDKIVEKAVNNGLITELKSQNMTIEDKCELIFEAGLSTADKVTDISGRGVGMDVVKTNITKLGGSLRITSEVNVGTEIAIILPLTLAILDGLNIRVGEEKYILPLNVIVESLQPIPEMVKNVGSGDQELLMLRKDFIPIVRLHKLFDVEPSYTYIPDGMLIIVKYGDRKIALYVDEFLDQYQVVVKPLDKNFRNVRGIGAATVRGDGSIGLILDVLGIIEEQKQIEKQRLKGD
jgi:two-component system chemotaxis sensor kinase CheA